MTETTTPVRALLDYVRRSTTVYRKGDIITEDFIGAMRVITVDAFPALPEGATTTVDCHFVTIGFTEALAELSHEEFYAAIEAATDGVFSPAPTWSSGPSYIAIGGWIGDQTDAFRFMACVQAHGLGKIIVPAMLGVTDPDLADQMAGSGYVMITGIKNPQED